MNSLETFRPSWMGPKPDTSLRSAISRTRKKTAPTQAERRATALAALEKFAVRCDDSGETQAAGKIRGFYEKASPFFTELVDLEKSLATPMPDPLGDAYAKAAKQLAKVLPHCFPSDEDALHFARRLNMGAATAEATKLADERHKINKRRHAADLAFWAEIQKGAKALFPGDDSELALKQLLKAGQ